MNTPRQLYFRFEDASDLLLEEDYPVSSPILYLAWQAKHIKRRNIARVWHSDLVIQARLNHGRWITDCPACGKGLDTHPEWKMACCIQCGGVFYGVMFPSNIPDMERVMLFRPRENQNWQFGETIEQLRSENVANGVPV